MSPRTGTPPLEHGASENAHIGSVGLANAASALDEHKTDDRNTHETEKPMTLSAQLDKENAEWQKADDLDESKILHHPSLAPLTANAHKRNQSARVRASGFKAAVQECHDIL